MYNFNNRQINIIKYLLDQTEYISAKNLATNFDVSIRTIRYDLELIENWLNDNKSTLVKIPNKGMLIKTQAGKEMLLETLKFISVENRVLSEKERIRYVVLEFLTENSELTIAEVSDRLSLSRNTIIKIIKPVKAYFFDHDLELVKIHAKGLKVVGPESYKRRLLTDIFLEILDISNVIGAMSDDLVYNNLIKYCDDNFEDYNISNIKAIFVQLLEIEEQFNFYLTDFAFARVIIYLTISVHRIKRGISLNKNLMINNQNTDNEIGEKIAKGLEDTFSIKVSESEVDEITNYIVESKSFISDDNNKYELQRYTNEIDELAKHIMEYSENELNVKLSNDSQLINDLSIHLKSSLMRIKNEKQLDNELSKEITKRFPFVYQIVEESIAKYGQYDFSVSELAYIALHIRAAYERNYLENYISTALVICQEGVSVLNILISTLQRNIPELRIIKTCSIFDYEKYKKDLDLVITTSNFKSKSIEVVKVSPFLENDEIYKVRQTLVKLNKFKQIYKYNQREQFEGGRIVLLEDLLSIDMIRLNVKANDWEDAIRKAADPLVVANKVENAYVDSMIQAVKELGPYIVIMPEIAFAHARPDETVKETCMSVMTLETPIEFGSKKNDPVSIVFAFGAVSGNDHLKALQDLAKFLAHDENVEYLKTATDCEEVLNKLKNI